MLQWLLNSKLQQNWKRKRLRFRKNVKNSRSEACSHPALPGLGVGVLRNSLLVLRVGLCEDHRRREEWRAATCSKLARLGLPPQPPATCYGPVAEHLAWAASRQDQDLDTWRKNGQSWPSISPRLGTKSKVPLLCATCYLCCYAEVTDRAWAPLGFFLSLSNTKGAKFHSPISPAMSDLWPQDLENQVPVSTILVPRCSWHGAAWQ